MSISASALQSFYAPAPPPPTRLGRHRQLAPRAGVHVSPICLGAMSIGDKWDSIGMGAMDKDGSFKLLDAFYNAGRNFIDTSNNYQGESSEQFIGEWMEMRANREDIVLATKYSSNFKHGQHLPQMTSYTGNNVKSMTVSVEASLKKLRTRYVDILYVHFWDYTSTIEEVMDGLHNLVTQGKVLYLGISDASAWVVAKANTYARMAHKTPFVIYQGFWSLLQRDFERDIIPMARAEGMALAPFHVLAAGKIRTDAEEERRRQTGENGRSLGGLPWERSPEQRKLCQALETVAAQVGAPSITSVAIAYVMQKTPHVFPIVGGRKVEHLMDNIAALSVALSPAQIAFLEGVLPFDLGWPARQFGDGSDYYLSYKTAGYFDKWPREEPIRPDVDSN